MKRITGAKVFLKFDMKSGFWQIGIKEDDRHKIAFVVPHGHYEWNVMPFDLKNAPSKFQNRMDEVYKSISRFCLIYIDDALIFSNSEEEHAEHLSEFKALTFRHGLALSESKMKIGLDEVDFLGLHIKQGFIIPQSHITEKIS